MNAASKAVTSEWSRRLATGFSQLGFDLQRLLPSNANTFASPVSIGAALATMYLGARRETAAEMVTVLHVSTAAEEVLAGLRGLREALAPREVSEHDWDADGNPVPVETEVFRLSLATALFVEEAYPLHASFCDEVSEAVGAEFFSDPFTDPVAAAARVNAWVRDQTEARIPRLASEETFDPAPKLVLANAVYFKARWLDQFWEGATRLEPFYRKDGERVEADAMHKQLDLAHWTDPNLGVDAVRVPYEQGVSMLVLLPEQGELPRLEAALSVDLLERMRREADVRLVDLQLPKLEMRYRTSLGESLRRLGMHTAFDPIRADFGGITPRPEGLVVSEVVHEAWVRIDEEGTEAAAATVLTALGGAFEEEPPQPVPFTVDRPYLFLIQDDQTGAVLFLGRVVDPTQ